MPLLFIVLVDFICPADMLLFCALTPMTMNVNDASKAITTIAFRMTLFILPPFQLVDLFGFSLLPRLYPLRAVINPPLQTTNTG